MEKLRYSKFKDDIKAELKFLDSFEEKIDFLIEQQNCLKKIRSNTKKDTKLEEKIKYLGSKIYRLRKVANKPESIDSKEHVIKISKKVKKTAKDDNEKLDERNIEYLREKMAINAPIIVDDPFEYIEALCLHIQNIDINLNSKNIKYYINELQEYFNDKKIPVITQKYYIKYLVDKFKKVRFKISKEEITNRESLKKIIEYLEKYEYEKLTIANVGITIINPDLLEQSLMKIKLMSKVQKSLEIYDDEEFLLVLLDYLERKVPTLSNEYVGNKHITKVIDYISENILELDSEFFVIFEYKLMDIDKRVINNQNYKPGKGILSKIKVSVGDILFKLESYKNSSITDNPITTRRMVKYIVNDLKDIEFLLIMVKKIPDFIDNKTFDEILETYFNIILNSNDHALIIYYQKVIEVLFKYSSFSIKEIISILNDKINNICSKNNFEDREDKDYRKALLNQTNMILKKIDGYYYNDLIEPYINIGYEDSNVSDNIIFTFDDKTTKVKENAFSINTEQRKVNGLIEDVYYLTLYTSDMSDYFDGKDFNESLIQLISSSMNLSGEKQKYSLDEGKIRNVIAFTFKMDQEANIEDIKVTKEKIKVTKNYYYDTLDEDLKNLTVLLNNQLIRFYFLGTTLIRKKIDKYNLENHKEKREYDGEFYRNPENFVKVFRQIDKTLTMYCNDAINKYFMDKGFTLIDRNYIDVYIKQMRKMENVRKQISNFEEILSTIDNECKLGVIYNASNINYRLSRHSRVSSPLREVDSMINQLLAYYYSNHYVDLEESKMISLVLDSICDELNICKQKQLTKSRKVVKLDKSDEEDTIV